MLQGVWASVARCERVLQGVRASFASVWDSDARCVG